MAEPISRLAALRAHLCDHSGDSADAVHALAALPTAATTSAFRYTLDPAPGEPPILTAEQRAFYEENGYIVVKNLVPIADLEMYRARFQAICDGKVPKAGIMTIMRDGTSCADFAIIFHQISPVLGSCVESHTLCGLVLLTICCDAQWRWPRAWQKAQATVNEANPTSRRSSTLRMMRCCFISAAIQTLCVLLPRSLAATSSPCTQVGCARLPFQLVSAAFRVLHGDGVDCSADQQTTGSRHIVIASSAASRPALLPVPPRRQDCVRMDCDAACHP
jgi:hypothetical protein